MGKKQDKNIKDKDSKKEEISMVINQAVQMDNTFFNDFLKINKVKINSIVPKNPPISIDDEWRNEDFWDEDNKEINNE